MQTNTHTHTSMDPPLVDLMCLYDFGHSTGYCTVLRESSRGSPSSLHLQLTHDLFHTSSLMTEQNRAAGPIRNQVGQVGGSPMVARNMNTRQVTAFSSGHQLGGEGNGNQQGMLSMQRDKWTMAPFKVRNRTLLLTDSVLPSAGHSASPKTFS